MALLVLYILFLTVAGIVAFVSLGRINALDARVTELEAQLRSGKTEHDVQSAVSPVVSREPAGSPKRPVNPATKTSGSPLPASLPPSAIRVHAARLIANIKSYWMIWLGGICVALAGIFMVRYSIESGLLGPAGRVILALVTGSAMLVCAEWLRRSRGGHASFAALAGGGSITLYAGIYAAQSMYSLIPHGLAFVGMALVSLATLALALLQGPVLAIMGLLGGYLVPVLLQNDSGNIVAALLYSVIISYAALTLMRYVYRHWLWLGLILGSIGWWCISLNTAAADNFRGIYLALIAYGMLAIPSADFLLRGQRIPDALTAPLFVVRGVRLSPMHLTAALLLAAMGMSLWHEGFTQGSLLRWLPFTALILAASGRQSVLQFAPWLMLSIQLLALGLGRVQTTANGLRLQALADTAAADFVRFAVVMSALYSLGALLHLRRDNRSHVWSSLALLAPLLWLALTYLLVSDLSPQLEWGLGPLALGMLYLAYSLHRLADDKQDVPSIWLIFGGHGAYTLAAAMLFREAGLTLALAAQLVSLCWLIRHFKLSNIDWLLKAMVAAVVCRLTFNPWLLSYPADVHWSLWTYGGSTLFAAIASRQLGADHRLRPWLEAAALHLLVLALAAETRYWLYDGNVFQREYGLTEAAINTSLWLALSLSYHYRSHVAQSLAGLYRRAAHILLCMGTANYVWVVLVLNPLWGGNSIGKTPVFNLLLLAYGLPVLLALLIQRHHALRYKRSAVRLAALGGLIFVSLEIRQLWHLADATGMSLGYSTGNGELYTYSIVWLVLAMAAMLYASSRHHSGLYRGGLWLLGLVILKIFAIDMAGLEGLLRVASFMGLGLALLGLAYLHKTLRDDAPADADPPA